MIRSPSISLPLLLLLFLFVLLILLVEVRVLTYAYRKVGVHPRYAFAVMLLSLVGSSTIWVPGEGPMESRAFFSAAVPEAASYRVQVLSFDWTCQGGGGGGM